MRDVAWAYRATLALIMVGAPACGGRTVVDESAGPVGGESFTVGSGGHSAAGGGAPTAGGRTFATGGASTAAAGVASTTTAGAARGSGGATVSGGGGTPVGAGGAPVVSGGGVPGRSGGAPGSGGVLGRSGGAPGSGGTPVINGSGGAPISSGGASGVGGSADARGGQGGAAGGASESSQWDCQSEFSACSFGTFEGSVWFGLELSAACRVTVARPRSVNDCRTGQAFVCVLAFLDKAPVLVNCECAPVGNDPDPCSCSTNLPWASASTPSVTPTSWVSAECQSVSPSENGVAHGVCGCSVGG
jgi:hypothetical protein